MSKTKSILYAVLTAGVLTAVFNFDGESIRFVSGNFDYCAALMVCIYSFSSKA
ncbi:hypothetical protein [Bacillus nakamurai]|uniref:hypothetical protein n=1 Tax=Bacillus nakamurai TaxID=1793963 RepID=UPI000AFCEA2E|nr:hypothetical protein [Bacillus nakamurai]MCC9021627.1 hypothetical protein [Bacillus nakamurai]